MWLLQKQTHTLTYTVNLYSLKALQHKIMLHHQCGKQHNMKLSLNLITSSQDPLDWLAVKSDIWGIWLRFIHQCVIHLFQEEESHGSLQPQICQKRSCRQKWTLSQFISKWRAESKVPGIKQYFLTFSKSLRIGHVIGERIELVCLKTVVRDVMWLKYKNYYMSKHGCNTAWFWKSWSVSLWFLIQCTKFITKKNECY